MAPHKTITVNGRVYDAVTGLPVDAPVASPVTQKATIAPLSPKPSVSPVSAAPKVARPVGTPRPDVVKITAKNAESVHSSVQHSQTLNRRAAKKPVVPNRPVTRRPVVGQQMDIARSTDVSRFAKHPVTAPVPVKPQAPATTPDKPAQTHPIVQRAFAHSKPKAVAPKAKPATPKEVKDAAISKALATPQQKWAPLTIESKKKTRRIIIIIAVILLFIAAIVTAYRLFPGISVSLASAQAGLSATYPEYTPDGYSLSQPVTYTDGEVTLKFHSNSNDNYYTVSQTRSSWDSSAALDNVVTPEAGADYVTTKERGLTIYTFKSVAVWVNGGILYKIDSKAPLSGDQIRRIATSL